MANKTEYEGVCFTSMIDTDGVQYSVTERAESSLDAYVNLKGTVAVMLEEGCLPFISQYNKAGEYTHTEENAPKEMSVLDTAKELGGVPKVTKEESASIASGLKEVPEGHNYLGMKNNKLEEIRENDSYDILAESYSYDGTWVNFYNGSSELSVAGTYYANKVGAKIFQEMFHWQPAQVKKAPIPGGSVLLYIVGVNSKGTVYQNIKGVELA